MSNDVNEVVFRGKLFKVVHAMQPDGRVFERAVRAPGLRLIIPDKAARTVLLTKEFRSELNGWDYRLPGGKVFDSLAEYDTFKASGQDMAQAAEKKARAEGSEEAGIDVTGLRLFKISTLGATVEWDLWCFEVTDWSRSADGQQLKRANKLSLTTGSAMIKLGRRSSMATCKRSGWRSYYCSGWSGSNSMAQALMMF